jgi:hypothetical protein
MRMTLLSLLHDQTHPRGNLNREDKNVCGFDKYTLPQVMMYSSVQETGGWIFNRNRREDPAPIILMLMLIFVDQSSLECLQDELL